MRKKIFSIVILCIAVMACNKDDDVGPDSGYKLDYYSSEISSSAIMNLEYNSGKEKIYAVGDNYYGDVSSFIVDNSTQTGYLVMLMDNSYYGDGEIFYYSSDKETNTPGNILITIEPIDDNRGYVNIFDYNWNIQEGQLIYKFLVDKSKTGDARFEEILDYSDSKSIYSLKYLLSENPEKLNNCEKNIKNGDIYDLEEKIDNTIKFFADPTNLYPPTALLKEFGSWLKNRGEIIYESRIIPILDGINWLWNSAKETYEDMEEKLETYDYENDYEIPTSYSAKIKEDPSDDNTMEKISEIEDIKENNEEYIYEEYIEQPDECNVQTQSGGYGTTITTHFLGIESGTVYINYDMYSIPDRMQVEYGGIIVASTPGNVSNTGTLEFYFNGTPPYDYTITVIGDDTGTAWDYVAGCPE